MFIKALGYGDDACKSDFAFLLYLLSFCISNEDGGCGRDVEKEVIVQCARPLTGSRYVSVPEREKGRNARERRRQAEEVSL